MHLPTRWQTNYNRSDAHDVFLVLDGQLRHSEFLLFLNHLEPDQVVQFGAHNLRVLTNVAIGAKLSKESKTRAEELVDACILERYRGGKFVLARKYARAAGVAADLRPRDVAYSRLQAFLDEHRRDGCAMEELLGVAPELSRSTIKRVLEELRQNGKAHSVGTRRQARWFPGAAK